MQVEREEEREWEEETKGQMLISFDTNFVRNNNKETAKIEWKWHFELNVEFRKTEISIFSY